MTFIGLTGMIDPVRPEVKDAIVECRGAGIKPIMITGDHINTAKAIARELGILSDDNQAMMGADIDKYSGLVGASTWRSTPISRSPLDKNPMPGHLSELHPVNEVNTKGQ